MRASSKPNCTQIDAEKAVKVVPDGQLNGVVEKLTKRAGMQKFLEQIDVKPIMDEVRQRMKQESNHSASFINTEVSIRASALSKTSPFVQEFTKEVNQILATVEFKNDLEQMLAPFVSEVTGHYPNREVVDMEVSNGTSTPDEEQPCSSKDPPPPVRITSSMLIPPPRTSTDQDGWPPLIPPTLESAISLPPLPPNMGTHNYYRRD
uniref:Uncharacterized protein n=1 Tax=Panagrellus redivivus TaxID=6233 RepID=A0A7E4UMG8_PANRE